MTETSMDTSFPWDGVMPLIGGMTLTQAQAESLLDSGRLYATMSNGVHWRLRRNGKTQTWKTRPGQYSIPVKAGLRSCARFTHEWRVGDHFIIKEE